jgi:uncharacterized protein YegL
VTGTNIHKALKTAIQISRLGKKLWRSTLDRNFRHPELVIMFLTDGEPSEGKTDPNKIISAATRWNKKCKASIFSLALGNDADMRFLRKLSLRNTGFARRIYEASDTALQLRDFYRQVASPLLANVTFRYHTDQVSCRFLEGRLKNLWTGGSAPLLCRGRRWLLRQVVVVGIT